MRELENVIERAVIVAKTDTLADVERFLHGAAPRPAVDLSLPFREAKARVVEEFERAYVVGSSRRTGASSPPPPSTPTWTRRTSRTRWRATGCAGREPPSLLVAGRPAGHWVTDTKTGRWYPYQELGGAAKHGDRHRIAAWPARGDWQREPAVALSARMHAPRRMLSPPGARTSARRTRWSRNRSFTER